ncbi:MAG: Fic family protein [Candidatus Saccharibacteria bacterium]
MANYFVYDDLLQNKLGISDPKDLKKAEQQIVSEKSALILNETLPNKFNFEYLLHIHKILFEDIYNFAGQIRTVDIAKPNSSAPFAYARFIETEAKRIFNILNDKNYLTNISKLEFIKEIAELSAELNALHPFRDGNGRTIRLFLIMLADNAGYLLDYSQVSSKELIDADKLAFDGDMKLLLDIYKKIVI